MVKQIFDFLLSFFGLIVLFPILLIISLISIITQGFPVLFFHERLGKDGNSFTMIKFRTMTNGPSISAEHDSTRLTKWGRFLRQTSIDELPVLINVLKGEMSLVGPRPLPIKYFSRFNSFQLKRLNVKPGITGLAQINGRNLLSWDEKFRYDINYVNDYSFLLDIKIIIKTIIVLLFKKNVRAKDQEIMPEFMGSKSKGDKD